jgi:hypothetical protein
MTVPIDSFGKAAAAYARAARGEPPSEAVAGGRQSFADMVRGALDDAVAGVAHPRRRRSRRSSKGPISTTS